VLVVLQIALGGWVSTNYAVLACRDFPTCQGQWWPTMDFAQGFTLRRELGETAQGGYLPFAALTAIHMTHRLAAVLVLAALGALAWALARSGDAALRRFAAALAALALLQLATGLSNVVLGWPLLAAVLHTGGAAALAMVLAHLLARAHVQPAEARRVARPSSPLHPAV
jgi:cytochrome c oxidase assembly protein subunit 15